MWNNRAVLEKNDCFKFVRRYSCSGSCKRQAIFQGSISSTCYTRLLLTYFCAKKIQSLNVTREKLREALLYKKFANKMLMKLTAGSSSGTEPGKLLLSTMTLDPSLKWGRGGGEGEGILVWVVDKPMTEETFHVVTISFPHFCLPVNIWTTLRVTVRFRLRRHTKASQGLKAMGSVLR